MKSEYAATSAPMPAMRAPGPSHFTRFSAPWISSCFLRSGPTRCVVRSLRSEDLETPPASHRGGRRSRPYRLRSLLQEPLACLMSAEQLRRMPFGGSFFSSCVDHRRLRSGSTGFLRNFSRSVLIRLGIRTCRSRGFADLSSTSNGPRRLRSPNARQGASSEP